MTERVICDVRAAQCRCFKDTGHVEAGDPVHACDPDRCTGSWEGTPEVEGGPKFAIVSLPFAVGDRALEPWEFE